MPEVSLGRVRRQRKIVGWLGIGAGAALTGGGIALAVLAKNSDNPSEQEAFSAVFIGTGMWNVGAGVSVLIWESAAETSLRVYQEGKSAHASNGQLRLGLIPAAGGAQLSAVGSF